MQPHVRNLHNSTSVYLLSPIGPAHDLDEDGTRTRCGVPAIGAVRATFAQVHVWLDHAVCIDCFGTKGTRWP